MAPPVPANATNTANEHSPLNPCDFPKTEHLKPKTIGEAEPEPTGKTSNHPFWSVDRQEFVQAGSLEIGERLQTLSGDVKVVQQKLPRPGPQPVFNLEVHNEHVYFVGQDGVLVHNSRQYNWMDDLAAQKSNVQRAVNSADSVISELGLGPSIREDLVKFYLSDTPRNIALGLNMKSLQKWAEKNDFATIGAMRKHMPESLLSLTQGQQMRVVLEHVDQIRFNSALRGRKYGELLDISRARGLDAKGDFLGSFTDYEIFLLQSQSHLRNKLVDGFSPFK